MVQSHKNGMKVSFSWLYTHVNKIKMSIGGDDKTYPLVRNNGFHMALYDKAGRVQRIIRIYKVTMIPELIK